MKVQVYGTGCAKCNMLEKAVKQAVKDTGVNAEVVKVSDIDAIVDAGILTTPGLAVDGKLKSQGRVPSQDEIKKWIRGKT